MPHSWPPTLVELRSERKLTDGREDERLTRALDAAIDYVADPDEGVRTDLAARFTAGSVPNTIWLGTLRLAARLHDRLRSPDGSVVFDEGLVGRVAGGDPDIDRLLGVGRFGRSVFA